MKWLTTNLIIGGVLILFTLAMFIFVIASGRGGDEALFLIIGHTAAWVEMVVIFYFRKKPPTALP